MRRKNYINLFCLLFIFCGILFSETIYVSTGMPLFGYMIGISSLSIKIRDMTTHLEKSSMTWNTRMCGSGWQLANRYIVIYTTCNYYWRLDIYTNNTSANTGYQRGGLISEDGNERIPVGWVMSGSTVSITNLGEPGELVKNTIVGSTTTYNMSWRYLKDKNDQDDPNTSAWDESWNNAYNCGYTLVCYGSGNSMYLSCGLETKSPTVVYLEALMNYISYNKNYTTKIYFDLVYY